MAVDTVKKIQVGEEKFINLDTFVRINRLTKRDFDEVNTQNGYAAVVFNDGHVERTWIVGRPNKGTLRLEASSRSERRSTVKRDEVQAIYQRKRGAARMSKPKSTPPRSEREYLRREMNRFGSMGRGGDWLSCLVQSQPKVAAKVYKMMAEDSARWAGRYNVGHPDQPPMESSYEHFMKAAIELWPEVVNWTGRKEA
jgi:hypothetical protein